MTPEEALQIEKYYTLLASYYQRALNDVVIGMYAKDLEDLDYNAVLAALNAYRLNPKNRSMPLPAQVRELILPTFSDESQAREIALRVQGAVVKFGYSNGNLAKEFIGEIGWSIVDRFGGWNYLCQNLGTNIDINSLQAQIREIAKTDVVKSDTSILKQLGLSKEQLKIDR